MRTVFITGISRGLGRELAHQLIQRGDQVWGSTHSGHSDLPVAGCVPIELSDEASITGGMATLTASIDHLDLLINSAGIDARSVEAPPADRGPFGLDADAFNTVIAVNATAPLLVTAAARPLLIRASGDADGSATVVNISSQLGSMEVAATMGGDTAYCASKAALNMVTVKQAATLADEGVIVVAVHPGWVQTDMGGPTATLTEPESASAIITTIDGLTPVDTGRFLRWDGTTHPW